MTAPSLSPQRCTQVNRKNKQCTQTDDLIDGRCIWHDPARQDELRARRRREKQQLPAIEQSCPDTFLPYLETVTPSFNWRWPHLRLVQEKLDAVTRGELKRLIICLPPRHGKTQQTTVRYSAYCIERNPKTHVIIGAHSQTLANKFSRGVRRITRGRVQMSIERVAVDDWETEAGGGLRAIGVGAGVVGEGGDLLIIDDPVRNREEVQSKTNRDRVWDWYTDDLYTRCEPGAAIILILTRWHQDDLAGRILASEDGPNWTVISLPALAEENDPLGRGCVVCPECHGSGELVEREQPAKCFACEGAGEVGEALCPDRYNEKALVHIRRVMGRGFAALYQQRPRPKEGDTFQRGWFEVVQAAPPQGQRVRWWDCGATQGGGDATAGVKLCLHDDIVYVEHVVRGFWGPTERDRIIRQTAEADGVSVHQWTEQEPGASGRTAAEAFVRLLKGFTAQFRTSSGDKELRAEPFASYAGAGFVKIVAGAWNGLFLDEICDFPTGKHDDQVDAAASAYNVLAASAPMIVTVSASAMAGLEQDSPWRCE